MVVVVAGGLVEQGTDSGEIVGGVGGCEVVQRALCGQIVGRAGRECGVVDGCGGAGC